MHTTLQPEYNKLTLALQDIFALTKGLDTAALNQPMESGKWSAGQTLWHVIRAMELSLDYLQFKLAQPHQFSNAGIGTNIRSFLLNRNLRSRRKFKAPAATANVPEQTTQAALLQYQETQLKRLSAILETFPQALLRKEVYKHPVAGRITLRQMLQFMTAHTFHHAMQLEAFFNNAQRK